MKNLFDQVFSTLRADITAQHRTAACNLLSTLIEKSAQSSQQDFQHLLWDTQSYWRDAFWIYLSQHHALNVKPSRQLLTSLTSVLVKCQDKDLCEPDKARLLDSLVRYIVNPSENAPTRPAMQTLAHWLSKRIISVPDLCEVLSKVSNAERADLALPPSVRGLLDVVLRLAPFEDFASSAGSLASLILQKAPATGESPSRLSLGGHHESTWVPTVLKTLSEKPQSLESFRHYVFPEVFQHDKAGFVTFLEDLGIQGILEENYSKARLPLPLPQCEEVLFCALSIGSKHGIVRVGDVEQHADGNSSALFFDKDVLCIPDVLLGNLLLSTSDAVRVAGLSMLTTTTTTTKPLSLGTRNALMQGLPLLHADSDAGFRSELFSLIKHLVDRVKAATANLARPPAKAKNTKTKSAEPSADPRKSSELVTAHRGFMQWYVSFLKTELRPTASYQRHVSALRCLSIIARSGVDPQVPGSLRSKSAGPVVSWPFELSVIDKDTTDLLIDLLLDPFDDVRSTAAEILSLVENTPQQQITISGTPVLVKVLTQAENMMRLSGRADQADGVAQLYSILFSRCSNLTVDSGEWWASQCGIVEHLAQSIEQTLQIASVDIGKAVSKHPLHGLFISIRCVPESHSCFGSH